MSQQSRPPSCGWASWGITTVFRQIRTDVVDNQIDTLGKAFQGLTVACARCHDHKLDPILTSDYYALYGVLTSSRMVMRDADLPDVNAAAKQRLRTSNRSYERSWRSNGFRKRA